MVENREYLKELNSFHIQSNAIICWHTDIIYIWRPAIKSVVNIGFWSHVSWILQLLHHNWAIFQCVHFIGLIWTHSSKEKLEFERMLVLFWIYLNETHQYYILVNINYSVLQGISCLQCLLAQFNKIIEKFNVPPLY